MKRLGIVVPYRNREQHLNVFVPHMRAYFARDVVAREIPYRVTIVEQEAGLPFNRGAMKNIGYLLASEDSDYTAFHDVDYLPIWADYSYVPIFTGIAWYGDAIKIDPSKFFGGVVLVPNSVFAQANGYSNMYWGWGFEDEDLLYRIGSTGMGVAKRKGTFQTLPHIDEGGQSPAALANWNLRQKKWRDGEFALKEDGLSNIDFEVLSRRKVAEGPTIEREAPWEIVTVRLKNSPGI
jgi:hypothetical protein